MSLSTAAIVAIKYLEVGWSTCINTKTVTSLSPFGTVVPERTLSKYNKHNLLLIALGLFHYICKRRL